MSGQVAFTFDSEIVSNMKWYEYRIIAASMFQWVNLPPGLESEKMELLLIDKGSVSFFNTDYGYFVLPFTHGGRLNVYGDVTSVRAVPINGQQIPQIDDIPRVLYDNSARTSFNIYLRAFANRLADIQKSIAIVERQARMPSIVKVNETNKESWARFQSKIDEGYPVIFTDEVMDMKSVEVFDTGFRTEMFMALWEDYNKVEGEIYNFLGTMFNVEQNKAAGVGVAETVMNYSQTFAFANSRLKQRQRWCEKINQEFNLGIWCEKSNEYQQIIEEMMNSSPREPGQIAQGAAEVKSAEDKEAANA